MIRGHAAGWAYAVQQKLWREWHLRMFQQRAVIVLWLRLFIADVFVVIVDDHLVPGMFLVLLMIVLMCLLVIVMCFLLLSSSLFVPGSVNDDHVVGRWCCGRLLRLFSFILFYSPSDNA